jgi:hypothetical protein
MKQPAATSRLCSKRARVGKDNIGACLDVLFMACPALFMGLFLLEDGQARARAGARARPTNPPAQVGGGR